MSLNLIIESGTYVGNGGTQTITIGTGWQPAVVFIASTRTGGPQSQRGIAFKTINMPGDLFLYANPQDVDYDPGLTILSNGFQVVNNEVNHSGTTFYWTALRAGPAIDTGTYAGVGVGSTTVVTGRQPSAVFLGHSTGVMMFGQKPGTLAGTDAFGYDGNTANHPQVTINANGFTAEGDWDVDGETYWWCAVYDLVGSTRHFQQATYTGTGSLQAIALGSQPRMLTIYDPTTKWALKPGQAPAQEFGQLASGYTWETILGISFSATGFTVQQPWSENTVPASVYDFLAGMR